MADPILLDRAADAALALVADKPWPQISLRDIAERAGVSLADLYAAAPSKLVLLAHLARRFDRAALETAADDAQPSAHDALFEALMARIEAMQPHRAALLAIARSGGLVFAVARLPLTARALLEAAGVPAGPIRLAAMTRVWARVLQVWRDDDGPALNRTMAEIDGRLRAMEDSLEKLGLAF